MTWLAVILGGALGSAARHGVNMATSRMMGAPGPWATAAVNLTGSFAIGLLAGVLAADRLSMTPHARAFVMVGVLGGFTTFSTYMLDSLTLVELHGPANAALNVFGQVALGVLVTYAGYHLGVRHL